jgi:hypothetical protein
MTEFCESLEAKINAVQPQGKEQHAVKLLAQKCLVVARKLQKDLRREDKSGLLGNVIKARLKKSSIERDNTELLRLQNSMQTQILGDSWIRNQAALVEQQHYFNDLDNQMQHFITMVATGHTQLEDFIQREAATTRSHTTAEGTKTRDHVTAQSSKIADHVTQEFELQERNTKWDRLLKSLEFPQMNARRNDPAIDAYENTFQWVFEENLQRSWDSFPSFLRSKQDTLYWISGKPGSGKSTLMKFLVGLPRPEIIWKNGLTTISSSLTFSGTGDL